MSFGKSVSLLGILLLGLLLYSIKSNAELPSRCSHEDPERNVYEMYSTLVTNQFRHMSREMSEQGKKKVKFGDVMKAMPSVQIIEEDVTLSYPEVTQSNAFVEGFYKAELKRNDFLIIPAMGIGLEVDKYDVIYFCVEYTPNEADRKVTILTMNPSFSTKYPFLDIFGKNREKIQPGDEDKPYYELHKKIFNKKLVSLTLNPISGAANFIEKALSSVHGLSRIFAVLNQNLIQNFAKIIDFAWFELRRWTINAGVHQLELTPDEIKMMYQVKILNVIAFRSRTKTIKKEIVGLQDEFFDKKEADVIVK